MMQNKTFGIIGFGNMARAILDPMIKNGLIIPEQAIIYNPTPDKANAYVAMGCRRAASAEEAAQSDFVLLGVKPFKVNEVLASVGKYLSGRCLIAIAAGITVESMQKLCAPGTNIVRVMPNATLTVGCGATVLAENPAIPPNIFDTVAAVFSCGGIIEVLPEEKINEITAVSGSSPAFFYRIIAVMVENAVKDGIPRETAYRLAVKTMEGAAKVLENTGLSTDELIRIVATPGGTTQAALESMDASGFDKHLSDAMDVCTRRTYELAKR